MKQFDCENFSMKIGDDRIKEVLVKKGKTFGEMDLQLSMKLSDEYRPGTRYCVLMEGEADSAVSAAARRLAASDKYSQFTVALALCGSSITHAIMGNLYLKINKPVTSTRYFDKREDALQWLRKKAL